jgi:hypothetical protein
VRGWLSIPRPLGCPLAVCCLRAGPPLIKRPTDRDSPPQALVVARETLLLAGGVRGAGDSAPTPLAPGAAFDDVWLLNLQAAIGPPRADSAYGRAPRSGVVWERCVLPCDRVHRAPHANAAAHALHGGAVVLLLGGHDPCDEADQFGDMEGDQAWAVHEAEGIAMGGALPSARPPRLNAGMGTEGMPHLLDHSAEAIDTRNSLWAGEKGTRVLVHSLQGQSELNGAVGSIVESPPQVMGAADNRVSVAVGPPHSKSVSIRRRNLQVSRCATLGETPAIVQPSAADQDGVAWALTPAMGYVLGPESSGAQYEGRLNTLRREQVRNGIVVNRLDVLPWEG